MFHSFVHVLKINDWTFVALVYDSSKEVLKLYDETLNMQQIPIASRIHRSFTKTISLGISQSAAMQEPNWAIACISLHDVILSQLEIAQLPCTCQFKNALPTVAEIVPSNRRDISLSFQCLSSVNSTLIGKQKGFFASSITFPLINF